jgi:putative SOS response-associated peptidase YedK
MCGRFTRNYCTWQQIQALYRLTVPAAIPNLQPRFNVCPTDPADAPVPRDGTRELATSRRKIGVLRRGNQQCDATQIAPG